MSSGLFRRKDTAGAIDVETKVAPPVLNEFPDFPAEDIRAYDEARDDEAMRLPELSKKKPSLFKRLFGSKLAPASGIPIKVIIGFLPDVSERDAKEYAFGVADKHFEQIGLTYYDAFPYGKGYAYEVHEGGHGRAYLPGIFERFERNGPFRTGEKTAVRIETATRLIEVSRTREGLTSILLPESTDATPTEDLVAGKALRPGMDKRTGFFILGVAIFTSGFSALLLAGTIFRLQPYDEPPPLRTETITASTLPRSQWARVEALPSGSYVKALRFKDGNWLAPELEKPTVQVPPAVPTTSAIPEAPKPSTSPRANPNPANTKG
ncbi:hypothetical protein LC612_30195 [Nostoc sp. CHAB 5834]|nr:hypothetical protein [Nostoc sp. CHAB 5834]